eukprot:359185-Chlamydomonas_euryale.AAC.9
MYYDTTRDATRACWWLQRQSNNSTKFLEILRRPSGTPTGRACTLKACLCPQGVPGLHAAGALPESTGVLMQPMRVLFPILNLVNLGTIHVLA